MIPPQTLAALALATAFKDITTLVMMIRFSVSADAVRFESAFSLLEEVLFEPVRTQTGEFPPADIRMPRHLRTLKLHSLRSHERWLADNRDFEVNVNLGHSTRLRYLEVDLSKLTRRHVLYAVTSVRSPRLETIVWRTRRAFNFAAELWSGLDTLLADRETLPALSKFIIGAPMPSKATFNPRLHMPRCDALGILSGDEDIKDAL
ncbi:hypothetical protein C8R47DRAFT_1066077 [Mycena vitilis]|nr:hypothetical protein C8R47DRAFT_1066077 [Mycena vitilis]